jgi:predicted lipoprotein
MKPKRGLLICAAAALLLVAAIGVDTKFVAIGSQDDVRGEKFSPSTFGATEFPNVQANIEERAVDIQTLSAAIVASKAEAGKKYGVATAVGPVIPVTFTGIVGDGKSGIYNVAVNGVPDGVVIRVQTGPAINGTELRDATGKIEFGQFTNQIEYQDAGSALNNELKKQVLSTIDNSALTGKTITVTGVFKLVNPKNWLVTPVRIKVQ